MKRNPAALVLIAVLATTVTSLVLAEAAASEKGQPIKSVSCPPECGFTVKSRDEKELIEAVKLHAKTMHNLTLTDEQVKGMMKEEPAPESAAKH